MKDKKKLPLVVIFGRTNVGKSTLFNRLVGREQAIVSNIEGTTRDYNEGTADWRKKSFTIIDTGGITDLKNLGKNEKNIKADTIEEKVQRQARQTLRRADLILFVVDAQSGFLSADRTMAIFLKKIFKENKNIILVVNKVDNQRLRKETAEFHKLSLGEPILISAATGAGTGDLLDIIVKKIKIGRQIKKIENLKSEIQNPINVCFIGKPNVGKSCLLNSILGEERVIVSPVPHTTREPQDIFINYKDNIIKLVDTAGISKSGLQAPYGKKEKKKALEKMGIAKSLNALNKADIALLIIDISQPITHQETKIAEEIISRKKSFVIIANKWDLIKERDTEKYTNYIYAKLPFARWAPIQFISALTGEKVQKIMDLILKISEERKKEISDEESKEFSKRIIKIHKPSKGKGALNPRIREFKQIKTNPPLFSLRIGSREDLHFSYIRFIENRLRQNFGFLGTPITINVTKNKPVHGKHNY